MAGAPAAFRRLVWPVDTERLRLRAAGLGDLPRLVAAVNDRRISDPTTIPHPYGAREGRGFVRGSRTKLRQGLGFDVLAFHREDGHLVGGLGLTLRAPTRRPAYAEVGYWVGVPDWGHGYASELLAEGLRLGFVGCRLHRIEAWVMGFNLASLRVLEKAGFSEEGRARESVHYRGRYYDRVLLGLLRSEYRGRARRRAPSD